MDAVERFIACCRAQGIGVSLTTSGGPLPRLRRAHEAGVQLLVGSDYLVPGVDVHRELALFVEAGLTPAQALRAATANPVETLRYE